MLLTPLFTSTSPSQTLMAWHASGELRSIAPEVEALFGVPQTAAHHPEVDTGVHVGLCLDVAARLDASDAVKFAVLVHDLGKARTPPAQWPQHINHERLGIAPVHALCSRLAVPDSWKQLALLVCEYHLHSHRLFEMRETSVLRLLADTGMEQDRQLLQDFTFACEADARGRLGRQDHPYLQGAYLRQVAEGLQPVPPLSVDSTSVKEWQQRHRARVAVVRAAKAVARPSSTSVAC